MAKPSKAALEAAARIAPDCALRQVRLLNRRISQWYEDALRPLGLRATQLTLLVAITHQRNARPADLAELLVMEKSTVSRTIDRLIDNDWVEALPAEDGRAQILHLTAEGNRLLAAALPLWLQAQDQVEEAFGAKGLEALERLSRKAQRT